MTTEVPTTSRVDGILQKLDTLGYRDTVPRRLVVESIALRTGSFTAQEIADELSDQGIGRATVFRTINVLQEMGLLNRLHVGEECHRYTLCDGHHHHHLVCTGCGQVYPFETCTVDSQAGEIAKQFGFTIKGHHLDVYGQCQACEARTTV